MEQQGSKSNFLRTSSGKFAGCSKGFSATNSIPLFKLSTPTAAWWHSFLPRGRKNLGELQSFTDSKVDKKLSNTSYRKQCQHFCQPQGEASPLPSAKRKLQGTWVSRTWEDAAASLQVTSTYLRSPGNSCSLSH